MPAIMPFSAPKKSTSPDSREGRRERAAALLNEMNAALGRRPAYPFSPSPRALEKMRFADQLAREDARAEG